MNTSYKCALVGLVMRTEIFCAIQLMVKHAAYTNEVYSSYSA